MSSAGQISYQLSFQACPIILNNGIAQFMPGGILPIISITEALSFAAGLLSGSTSSLNLDTLFAQWAPLNARVISQKIGKYPFANQGTAANAVISNALSVSMLLNCPARGPGGYATKLATMTALIAALKSHNASGGTYTIATPSYFYTDCVMDGDMVDVTPAESRNPQEMWRLDFAQPLLTLDQAQQAQNALMSKISGGTQLGQTPTWSGLTPTVGAPQTLAGPSLIPAASNTAGSNVGAPSGGP